MKLGLGLGLSKARGGLPGGALLFNGAAITFNGQTLTYNP